MALDPADPALDQLGKGGTTAQSRTPEIASNLLINTNLNADLSVIDSDYLTNTDAMRVALVLDPMSAYGGAERVVKQLLALYPTADLFCVMEALPPDQRAFLGGRPVQCSFLQHLPYSRKYFRKLLPLWPLGVEQFDLSGYDLVISSHHSVAYGVIPRPGQVHVSYVHSPMRYAWDLQHQYLSDARLDCGWRSWWAKRALHQIRLWDFAAAQRPDCLVASSNFVCERIRKALGRNARVVYPPVDVDEFPLVSKKDDFYVCASRLVPHKKVDLLVKAFAHMHNRRLVVIGTGSELRKLRRIGTPNVEFVGWLCSSDLRELIAAAKAFIFAAIEDFGIAPVEAQASGTPVIAFGRGGVTETVRGQGMPDPTGVFFHQQTPEAVADAVNLFEACHATFRPEACRRNALRFGAGRFRHQFATVVKEVIADSHSGPPMQQLGSQI